MAVCDACVEQLRDKRQQWIECLEGEDSNSIFNQLTKSTWNITAFRVLMEEAFDLAPDAKEGGKQLNRLLFGLLEDSFLDSLLLGLRRLMDPGRLEGKKGVFSLPSLLDDIAQNSHLLTRDAIIRLGPPGENHGHLWLQDWPRIKNKLIDELVGTTEGRRSFDDQIPRALFENRRIILEDKFKRAKDLINKHIAHAAIPQSRHGFDYNGILWGDLYNFHGELCKTAYFLLNMICESGLHSFLPVFQGDEFDYLSRPIVLEADFQKLADRWAALNDKYASWKSWRPG